MVRALASRPVRDRYAVVVAFATVLLVASIVDPGESAGRTVFGLGPSTVAHVAGYGALSAAICWARRRIDRRTVPIAVLVAVLYGAGIELLQWPLPYRTASLLDVAVNAAGAVLGAVCWWAVRRTISRST